MSQTPELSTLNGSKDPPWEPGPIPVPCLREWPCHPPSGEASSSKKSSIPTAIHAPASLLPTLPYPTSSSPWLSTPASSSPRLSTPASLLSTLPYPASSSAGLSYPAFLLSTLPYPNILLFVWAHGLESPAWPPASPLLLYNSPLPLQPAIY